VTEGWAWDETLYAGSAEHYATGRLPYPDELGVQITAAAEVGAHSRALDVGCGPGSLTLLLARHVGQVVAIDADQGMIAHAQEVARRGEVANVSWRQMRAEDLPADLCEFDLITFAQSFHWMERLKVATIARKMLRPGGSCVHVHALTHRGDSSLDPLPHPRPPYDEIDSLVRSYLGPRRRAGRSVVPRENPDNEDQVYAAAGFTGSMHVEIPRGDVVERTVDQVVAATFSLSSSTPHLFGTRQPDFEAELRALLKAASDNGLFSERVRDIAFDVWRPARER
jgi:SAM-dependent methyltransferase